MLPAIELAKQLSSVGNVPKILAAEEWMLQNGGREGVKEILKYEHFFIPGVYVRKMFIPAGGVLTGRIHKQQDLSIFAQGKMKIVYPDREAIVDATKAPIVRVCEPGEKKIGLALTDCVFIDVFRTENQNLDTIEDELSSETFIDYATFLLGDAQ